MTLGVSMLLFKMSETFFSAAFSSYVYIGVLQH